MEHVEQAIDDFVNFQEVAPQIIKLTEERKCTYCQKNAVYEIIK
jgi:CxxH/CxxC protein (TIGR04129 family)